MRPGDRVETKHGFVGTIDESFENFEQLKNSEGAYVSMAGKEWLDAQLIPVTDAQLKERWHSLTLDDGGMTAEPESLLNPIQ